MTVLLLATQMLHMTVLLLAIGAAAAAAPSPRLRIHRTMNRAIDFSEADRHAEAITHFAAAIDDAADTAATVSASFDEWLALEELRTRCWFNLGAVLNTARRRDESLAAFARAVRAGERAARERDAKLRAVLADGRLSVAVKADHTVRLLQLAEYAVSARMHMAGRRGTDEAIALLHAAGGAAIAALASVEEKDGGGGGDRAKRRDRSGGGGVRAPVPPPVPPIPGADTAAGREWRRLAAALREFGAQALFNAAALLTNERARHDEALAALRAGLALHPREVLASGRSEVLVRAAALQHFGARVHGAPGAAAACGDVVELGHALAGVGRYREARAAYARALAANPAHADAHYGAGVVALQGFGRGGEARAHLAAAVALDPGHAAARVDRGLAEAEPRVRSRDNDGTRFLPAFPFGAQYYAPEAVEARFEEVAPGLVRVSHALTEPQMRALAAALARVEQDPAYARMVNTSRAFGDATAYDVGGHAVTYVHDFLPPELFWRLRGLALRADLAARWGLAAEIPPWRWNARCIESLVYTPSPGSAPSSNEEEENEGSGGDGGGGGGTAAGGDSIGWHDDSGSFVTISVGLSDLGDYDGGAFEIKRDNADPFAPGGAAGARHNLIGRESVGEADGGKNGKVAYALRVDRGDMMVWFAWRRHRVTPVTRGRRHVLVLEFWDALPRRGRDGGPERPAPHPSRAMLQARAIDRAYGPGKLGPRSQDASWRDELFNAKEQCILRAESEFDRQWR